MAEANNSEWLLPWGGFHHDRVVLGSCIEEACTSPSDLKLLAHLCRGEK